MVYVILAAGIILIILGLRGDILRHEVLPEKANDDTAFDNVLSDNLVLQKLDSIDEKLLELKSEMDAVKGAVSAINMAAVADDGPELEAMDVNQQVTVLKNKGLNIEEIAAILGVKKGEILLRLGMKK